MSEGGWFDTEAIEQERFDADMEMAEFQAAGRQYWIRTQKVKLLQSRGEFEKAAALCWHDWTGRSEANPAETECLHCGSIVTDFRGTVVRVGKGGKA